MTELKLNVDSKDIIEAGDPKSAQRGMLTFSKNTVYLGDGDKANKIIDGETDNKVTKLLTTNMTITLGETQGFSNDRYGLINAINEAGKYRSVNSAKITIKLPTDLTLSNSMVFKSVDLSHVIIEGRSNDDRTVLKFANGVNDKFIFNFDYCSGPTFRYLSLQDNRDNFNTGIALYNNSTVSIENITINGFKNGIR